MPATRRERLRSRLELEADDMRVMGVDQALTVSGWAVIETNGVPGAEVVLKTGTIVTTPACPDQERQDIIGAALEVVARDCGAGLIGLEGTYVRQNPQTALRLTELRGALIGRLHQVCPVVTVPTSTRRSCLGIAGRSYHQVKQAAVDTAALRYGLDVTADEADAIGIALGAVVVQRRDARKGQQETLGIKPGRKQRRRAA